MSPRQTTIDLEDATAGMVLSSVLLDAGGGTLLPKGAELTDALLTSLRRRGVERIAIVDNSQSDAELAAERERVAKRLASLFRKCANQNATNALQNSILLYRVEG
jgi:chromatin segregation and condensation protein Rec8/ScpA/Scc1 (kleisin family)